MRWHQSCRDVLHIPDFRSYFSALFDKHPDITTNVNNMEVRSEIVNISRFSMPNS